MKTGLSKLEIAKCTTMFDVRESLVEDDDFEFGVLTQLEKLFQAKSLNEKPFAFVSVYDLVILCSEDIDSMALLLGIEPAIHIALDRKRQKVDFVNSRWATFMEETIGINE